MKSVTILFLFLLTLCSPRLSGASAGDFRSKNSGYWNQASTWQYYNGSSWVNATYAPTYLDGEIDVLAGHSVTVTVNVTADELDVAGYLTINAGVTFTLNDGYSTDLSIANRVFVNGILLVKGTIVNNASELVIQNGGIYQYNRDGGTLDDATWNDGSTCEITGIVSSSSLSGANQSFYHFKWNCPSQVSETNLAGDLETIRGNLIMVSTGTGNMKMGQTADYMLTISGGWIHQNGVLNMGGGSSNAYINLAGNFTMQAGKITEYNSASYISKITFTKSGTQTMNKTGGTFENNIDFEVLTGCTLDMGESVIDGSAGFFSLNGGATLRTAHSGGIASSGASGCIRTTTRYFSSAAHYHFNRNGSQKTGNGLPSPLTGKLMIGSSAAATNLTLSNGSVTISNLLLLCSSTTANSSIASGTVIYGLSASLEYQGMTTQTTGIREWPDASAPYNLIMNNPFGVNLNFTRTINGNLNLVQGTFAIGSNTLLLKGTIIQSAGSLTGGANSSIAFLPGSVAATLPAVQLLNLTIDRASGVNMTGNLTVYGTLTLNDGIFTIGPGAILSLFGNPVAGNSGLLAAGPASRLTIGGTSTGFTIPSGITQLGSLMLMNPNGAVLSSDIEIFNSLIIQGKVVLGQYQLFGPASMNIMPESYLISAHPEGFAGNMALNGLQLIDGNVDYEFNGFTDQFTGFLPTTPPETIRNLYVRNPGSSTLFLNSDITVSGSVEISPVSKLTVSSTAGCTVAGSVYIFSKLTP